MKLGKAWLAHDVISKKKTVIAQIWEYDFNQKKYHVALSSCTQRPQKFQLCLLKLSENKRFVDMGHKSNVLEKPANDLSFSWAEMRNKRSLADWINTVFSDTWVWVLEFLLEPGKSWAQGLGILEKHLIHDQHSFFSDVRFSVGHLQ